MLIIHGGLPKTATTPLQQRLHDCAVALKETGVIYPQDFRTSDLVAHHQIPHEIIGLKSADGPAINQLLQLLEQNRNKTVLISSEAFTNCISDKVLKPLKQFLKAARHIMPVTWVCSLRRTDDFMQSMYLHQVKVGEVKSDIGTYLSHRWHWLPRLLRHLKDLEHLGFVDHMRYVRYGTDEYFRDLWKAFGLTSEQIEVIGDVPRTNESLAPKSYALSLHSEAFEGSFGPEFKMDFVLKQLAKGAIALPKPEGAFSVIPYEHRMLLHEAALRASLEHNNTAYFDFFGKDLIAKTPTTEIRPDMLIETDIRDLLTQLRSPPHLD